jgi:hypothetical protein
MRHYFAEAARRFQVCYGGHLLRSQMAAGVTDVGLGQLSVKNHISEVATPTSAALNGTFLEVS